MLSWWDAPHEIAREDAEVLRKLSLDIGEFVWRAFVNGTEVAVEREWGAFSINLGHLELGTEGGAMGIGEWEGCAGGQVGWA